MTKHNLVDIWRDQHPDSFRCSYGKAFSFKTSRLDRFYVSQSIAELVISSKIIPNNTSDHNPVTIRLKSPKNSIKGKASWRLNSNLLIQNSFKTMVLDTINRTRERFISNSLGPSNSYSILKSNLCRKARRFTIGNNKKLKTLIEETREKINKLESEDILSQNSSQDILQYLKMKLSDLEHQAFAKAQLNAATTSADTTERATKTFFNSIKPRIKNVLINSLKTKEGSIARSTSDIAETACRFYEDLYQLRRTSQQHIDILLNTMTKKVTSPFYDRMNSPITPQEIKTAIQWIASGKAPGPDGLGSEFYKTFSNELSDHLAAVYNECIEKEMLPECMSNATIHLLFKKGDPQNLGNWRPISLLNVDYKILAKIINDRMKPSMPQIIHMDQKGFVPERSLEDAVQKTTHLIRYCHRENIPAYLMLLDQEKAFDKVSREYLHQVLEKANFPPLIRKAVKAMYASTTANININGSASRTVNLLSGVRQGCSLSPTLFALCIEPLANLIRNNQRFKGLQIPNVGSFKISKFADDTTFIIRGQQDHDIALEAIHTYELATAAKAKVSKTEILPIGPNIHATTNPLNTEIALLPHNSDVRFLGNKIGNNVDTDAIWNEKIDKLEKSLQLWSQKFLTYEGRVFVLKQQALASIWFQAKFHYLPPNKIREIEAKIKAFINSNKNKTIINYNLMKLPKNLGGQDAIDVQLYSESLRMRWMHYLLDNKNHAEWKKLALLELDHIGQTPNLGLNIINDPIKRPKKAADGFWQANIHFFIKLGGQYNPAPLRNHFTPKRLLEEPISSFSTMKSLINCNITKTAQVIKDFTNDCNPQLMSPQTIKTTYSTKRKLQQRAMLSLEASIPSTTIPRGMFWMKTTNRPSSWKLPKTITNLTPTKPNASDPHHLSLKYLYKPTLLKSLMYVILH